MLVSEVHDKPQVVSTRPEISLHLIIIRLGGKRLSFYLQEKRIVYNKIYAICKLITDIWQRKCFFSFKTYAFILKSRLKSICILLLAAKSSQLVCDVKTNTSNYIRKLRVD